jgi:plasmid stability protein
MSMIQIRNVPEDLHRELKARAAQNGKSLSDYLLEELRMLAPRPTMQEWVARAARLTPIEVDETPAEAIAAERARKPV